MYSKEYNQSCEGYPTEWEKNLYFCTTDRGLVFRIHKECKNPKHQEIEESNKEWDVELYRDFFFTRRNTKD